MTDVQKLSQPLNENAPCGEDSEYTSAFMEMEKAKRGEPERQVGNAIIPAVEPDWKLVKKYALELFKSTRDLRVATDLCAALIHTEGFSGFRDGLQLIEKLLANFWDELYPELDPDDDNPAMMRANTLLYLVNHTFLISIKKQPLIISRVLGKFSSQDIQDVYNFKNSDIDEERQKHQLVEAVFKETSLDNLQGILDTLQTCQQSLKTIIRLFQEKAGYSNAPDLTPLLEVINHVIKLIIAKLPAPAMDLSPTPEPQTSRTNTGQGYNTPLSSTLVLTASKDILMGIQNRDEVLIALDQICDYYSRYEPSSPIPLLLKRARRLVNKEFIEILQDLNPDSVTQIENLLGIRDN